MAKRERCPTPADVVRALKKHRVMSADRQRPSYQQNDYIGWITEAKCEETRRKGLDRMLDELDRGCVHMKVAHNPSAS